MNKNIPKLLPNINDYLEDIGNNYPVSITGLDYLKEIILSKTNLNEEKCDKIIALFFQEIRNYIIRGKQVNLKGLGSFKLSSPKSGTKKKIFVKFKPSKILIQRMNETK